MILILSFIWINYVFEKKNYFQTTFLIRVALHIIIIIIIILFYSINLMSYFLRLNMLVYICLLVFQFLFL
jgi:hypothetical protein